MKTSYLRWMARTVSLALVALFVAIVVGEGPSPVRPLSIHTLLTVLLIACHFGLLLAWRWELAGGLLAIGSISGFYLLDFAAGGFERLPGGWVFPSLFITGLLFVLVGVNGCKMRTGEAVRASRPSPT